MTPASQRIAQIRTREQAATPGPWEHDTSGRGGYNLHGAWFGGYIPRNPPLGTPELWMAEKLADAAFISAARSDIPWLVARLQKAEALLERAVTDGISRACGDDEISAFLFPDDTTTEGSNK